METVAKPFLYVAAKGSDYLSKNALVQKHWPQLAVSSLMLRENTMAATFGLYADRSRLRWHVIAFIFIAPIPLSVPASAVMALVEIGRDLKTLIDKKRLGYNHPDRLDMMQRVHQNLRKPEKSAKHHRIIDGQEFEKFSAAFSFRSKGNMTVKHGGSNAYQDRDTGIKAGFVSGPVFTGQIAASPA